MLPAMSSLRSRALKSALLSGIFLFPAQGALITYSSRAMFNSAAPGLPTETFESGLVAASSVTNCNGPLSSASASACFTAGALLPGVTYNASGTFQPNMALLGANFPGVGNTSKVLGPNSFGDTFDLTFAMANAAGFDVFAGTVAGNINITVFSTTNVQLGLFVISVPIGGTFFGVVSDSGPIGRINIASLSISPGELVDNLSFGTTAIPEPASLLLSGGALVGLILIRRRRTC